MSKLKDFINQIVQPTKSNEQKLSEEEDFRLRSELRLLLVRDQQ